MTAIIKLVGTDHIVFLPGQVLFQISSINRKILQEYLKKSSFCSYIIIKSLKWLQEDFYRILNTAGVLVTRPSVQELPNMLEMPSEVVKNFLKVIIFVMFFIYFESIVQFKFPSTHLKYNMTLKNCRTSHMKQFSGI